MIAYNDNNTLIELGGKTTSMFGTCSSAEDATTKTVNISNFDSLKTGATVRIQFINSNTAMNPFLNVSDTGAKPMYRYGTTPIGQDTDSSWQAGSVVQFTYNGGAWIVAGQSGSGLSGVVDTAHGGTGNPDGYIRTGQRDNSDVGEYATVEGHFNVASGDYSHAEGKSNQALGDYTHVSGQSNTAGHDSQTVVGQFNYNKRDTLFEVGNGTLDGMVVEMNNAFEVYKEGGISTDNGDTKIRFGQDSNGNYGYYKGTSSTLIPFSSESSSVTPNPSNEPTDNLNSLKIGSTTYDTSGIKQYEIEYIEDNKLSITAASANGINGNLIVVHSGTNSSTTSSSWSLSISGLMVVPVVLSMKKQDGTAFSDAIVANEYLVLRLSISGGSGTATVMGTIGQSGGGGGLPSDPLTIDHGGTGNSVGYIQTGKAINSTVGQEATVEGYGNVGSGSRSHAEGINTTASQVGAHSEGSLTTASGGYSHAEGYHTAASGNFAHSAGLYTTAGYEAQTVVGKYNKNKSTTLFEVGNGSGTTSSEQSNAFEVYSSEGISTDDGATKIRFGQDSSGNYGYYKGSDTTFNKFDTGMPENPLGISHGGTGNTDGYIRTGRLAGTAVGTKATVEGKDCTASGNYSHAEGCETVASGSYSHAEGQSTNATKSWAHSEGYSTTASGTHSHAEGNECQATGNYSHAEGLRSKATGLYAHAEGYNNISSGYGSHSEGDSCTAQGYYSHAEGSGTVAGGYYAHAGGYQSSALGSGDFTHGKGLKLEGSYQTAFGLFNDNKTDTLFEIGNGTSASAKLNVFEVYKEEGISTDNGTTKIRFGQDGSGNYGYYKGSDATLNLFGSGGGGGTSNYNDLSNKPSINSVTLSGNKSLTDLGITAVTANPSGSATGGNLTKLQVGSTIYSIPSGSGGLPSDPLSVDHGGTGNAYGYVQVGAVDSGTTLGNCATAEGYGTESSAYCSHAEGVATSARGSGAHAEGNYSDAEGSYSHAQGYYTYTKGIASFAGGYCTEVRGDYSFAFGYKDPYSSASYLTRNYTFFVGSEQARLGRNALHGGFSRGTKILDISDGSEVEATFGAMFENSAGGTRVLHFTEGASMYLVTISIWDKNDSNLLISSVVYYIASGGSSFESTGVIKVTSCGPQNDAISIAYKSSSVGRYNVIPGSSYTSQPWIGQVTRLL